MLEFHTTVLFNRSHFCTRFAVSFTFLQCFDAVGWAVVVRYWRGYLSGVRCK